MTKKYMPDLIVADFMMPLLSGLDMIQMIRESEKLKGIPIILLTAKVDKDTPLESVEKGVDSYWLLVIGYCLTILGLTLLYIRCYSCYTIDP